MKRTLSTLAALALALAAADALAAKPRAAAETAVAKAKPAIAEEDEAVSKVWQGKIAVGIDSRSGNTEKNAFSAHADAKKLQGKTIVIATIDGAYEEQEVEDSEGHKTDEQTVGQVKGEIELKQRFTGFFVYGDVSGENDEIADVRYRFIESLGLGTFLCDFDTFKLSVEAGVAQVQEKLKGYDSEDYTAWRVAERADWTPSFANGVSFFEAADYLADFDDSDHYLANIEAGVDIPMFLGTSVTLKGVLSRNNQPAEGKEKNDSQILVQIGYNF